MDPAPTCSTCCFWDRENKSYQCWSSPETVRPSLGAPGREKIHENAQLNRQVTDIQQRCTELLEEKRRAHVDYAVREFHLKYGHPAPERLTLPDEAMIRFRLKLVAEEFLELVEAAFKSQRPWTVGPEKTSTHLEKTRENLAWIIANAPIDLNLPEFMDATHDLDYVVAGTRVVFGYNGLPGAAEVHRSNMSKIQNGLDKPTKPEGWRAPDIAGVLKAQGFEPQAPKKEV